VVPGKPSSSATNTPSEIGRPSPAAVKGGRRRLTRLTNSSCTDGPRLMRNLYKRWQPTIPLYRQIHRLRITMEEVFSLFRVMADRTSKSRKRGATRNAVPIHHASPRFSPTRNPSCSTPQNPGPRGSISGLPSTSACANNLSTLQVLLQPDSIRLTTRWICKGPFRPLPEPPLLFGVAGRSARNPPSERKLARGPHRPPQKDEHLPFAVLPAAGRAK